MSNKHFASFDRVISDRNGVRVTQVGEPLSRIPIRHACGHFELRMTRWNGESANIAQGFIQAGSECTQCAPLGRPIGPNYDTLEAAQEASA